jgi:hypothetical protein
MALPVLGGELCMQCVSTAFFVVIIQTHLQRIKSNLMTAPGPVYVISGGGRNG